MHSTQLCALEKHFKKKATCDGHLMEYFIVYGQATQGGVSSQLVLKWKLMYIFMTLVMF